MRLVRFCIHPETLITILTTVKRIATYRSREERLERVESVLKFHALSPGGGILKTWHRELRERVKIMLASRMLLIKRDRDMVVRRSLILGREQLFPLFSLCR